MQALGDLGHEVGLVTLDESPEEALRDLRLVFHHRLGTASSSAARPRAHSLSRLQERFRSYFGIAPAAIAELQQILSDEAADAFVAGGLDILPYFAAARNVVSVWYAADELAWHHLSLLRPLDRRSWEHGKEALIKAMYERAFQPLIDRAWVVSPAEARAMRWFAGVRNSDVVPNGVDTRLYQPIAADEEPSSAVFWGRLDFGPNVQALEWFVSRVWPNVLEAVPDARFTIMGFNPGTEVGELARQPGIRLLADLPDLRPHVARHATVVLPFVSGGGIKNKLLEAAALGKAIVCTPRACGGLREVGSAPLVQARTAAEWVTALSELWTSPGRRQALGDAARRWVMTHHTWRAAADAALVGLRQSLAERQMRDRVA
jgi:polysaccharide biosynthesis protein PslH